MLDGHEAEAATAKVREAFAHAVETEPDSTVFWLSLAAAQMETGRLQEPVKERALTVIDAGGDVERWADEDPGLAVQREQVLRRLAAKLNGPQPAPKRLRRQKAFGRQFNIGDVIRVTSRSGQTQAFAVVVAHHAGHPRGTVDPVVELLAWDDESAPRREEMEELPSVRALNDVPTAPGGYRPQMWVLITARKDQVFSSQHGEVIETGIRRKPSGDPATSDAFSDVGTAYCAWPTLCLYLDQEYRDDLRATFEAQRGRGLWSRLKRRLA